MEKTGSAEASGSPEVKEKRPTAAMAIVAFIIFATAAVHLYYGIKTLFDLGIFGDVLLPPFFSNVGLTEAGRRLFASDFDVAFGLACLVLLVGFLRRRRWAWVTMMTIVALSLAVGLFRYFLHEPRYPNMLAGVVLMFVLNLASMHRAFDIGRS